MTFPLIQNLHKKARYNLHSVTAFANAELPFIASFANLLSGDSDTPLACTCCGWKGSEMKARKHYLIVEAIAELEFFCPACNQYLGYISEPARY